MNKKILASLFLPILMAQQVPNPTAHMHSSAAQSLIRHPDLAWAAQYCDEENPYISCYNLGIKGGASIQLALKGYVGYVALVMENNKVLQMGKDYTLIYRLTPIPAPGTNDAIQSPMTGNMLDNWLQRTTDAGSHNEFIVVFYQGYQQYTPHHKVKTD